MFSSPFVFSVVLLLTLNIPTRNCRRLWRIEPRILWEPQRREEITPLSVLSDRFFILKGFSMNGISNLVFQRTPTVHLPMVDVSSELDLKPNLIAYDPSFIEFPPPPQIPESDGYKTQFVCDYEYDPMEDSGSDYLEYCFYYFYTPKQSHGFFF